jgi:hypothetical protein
MSQTDVHAIMGTPIRTDSIYHQLELDLGAMTWESLDSIRRTLPQDEANKMSLGRPIDHSTHSDQFVSWYYGPVVVDTMFTFERVSTKAVSLARVSFQVWKQRAVVFDARTGTVKERGFSVLEVIPL